METDFGLDAVLSRITTEVDTDATVTPVICTIAEALSAFWSCAVAFELGGVDIAYGGIPPLTVTSCDVPAPTVTDGGAAFNDGGGVEEGG